VSRLYKSRISGWALVMLALAALITLVVAMLSLPLGHTYLLYLHVVLNHVKQWLTGLF
jgi:uncharacterized membrane-anchored protein